MSNFNTDLIEDIEPLVFCNYEEFKEWLTTEHGADVREFISLPIDLVDQDEFFNKYWKVCDRLQSGQVMYKRR